MDSNLYISALQRQPCLLKTNSTRVLVTCLITLLLMICPSLYKARLDNLIGPAISVRKQFLPNGVMPDRTSRLQMLWAGLSSVWYPGYILLPLSEQFLRRDEAACGRSVSTRHTW